MILTADAGCRGASASEYPPLTLGGCMADLVRYRLDDQATVLAVLAGLAGLGA